ncbi:MAG: peptidoglycan DD-metalloendopeptidase family protein [Hyphomicrobiaceae bacterium]|nr:peptidoglycan DD-metalloendopeptidase family protein [Hyphomicrobiaceae bacterium]
MSTCLAAVVGVGVIGSSIYASMDVEDGTGIVSSIRHAGLAAMKPVQKALPVAALQSVAGQKTDRIPTTTEGLSTRHIIHDTVVQKRNDREYIRIKPYARLVARLGTSHPDDISNIPAFNPFKLYSNPKPVAENAQGEAQIDSSRDARIETYELEGGILPTNDGLALSAKELTELMAERDALVAVQPFAMRPGIDPEGEPSGLVKRAAYHPDDTPSPRDLGRRVPPNTTIVAKTVETLEGVDEVADGTETTAVTVKKGDTLMSILADAGAEKWQAKAIADAMAPVFKPKNLNSGQEVRFTLVPAPKNDGQMEPVKVSLFAGGTHKVTVARDDAGDYVASNEPIKLVVAKNLRRSIRPKRASLYTSFYHSALNQGVAVEQITKLLRIHSYDVDFKRPTHPGDSFEVFFGLEKDDSGQEKALGDVLFTAMTVGGEARRYYRFRTPDGDVDFYDRDGNSAKKFLMRKPVKGARFTSAFGMRKHPILGYRKMHTGTDWAAKTGTPILAAGSGVVEEARRKGGNGNYVRIRHANGYKTAYSHMSRFARGLRPGMKVQLGQVIGYVGSTGLSSGPHLHFEVLVNNRFVNPMTIHVPRGRQLTGKELANFYKERNRIDGLMQRSPVTTRMASVQK